MNNAPATPLDVLRDCHVILNHAPYLYEILFQTDSGYTRVQIDGDGHPSFDPTVADPCAMSARSNAINALIDYGVDPRRATATVDRVMTAAMTRGYDTGACVVADGPHNGYTAIVLAPDA